MNNLRNSVRKLTHSLGGVLCGCVVRGKCSGNANPVKVICVGYMGGGRTSNGSLNSCCLPNMVITGGFG